MSNAAVAYHSRPAAGGQPYDFNVPPRTPLYPQGNGSPTKSIAQQHIMSAFEERFSTFSRLTKMLRSAASAASVAVCAQLVCSLKQRVSIAISTSAAISAAAASLDGGLRRLAATLRKDCNCKLTFNGTKKSR